MKVGDLFKALVGVGRTVELAPEQAKAKASASLGAAAPHALASPNDRRLKSVAGQDAVTRGQEGRPIATTWSTDKAVQQGMAASIVVFACVTKIARNAASLPWHVEELQGGKWVRVEGSSEIGALWDAPNPFQSRQDLCERMIMHLLLCGNCVMTKLRGVGGVPRELWTMSPERVRPVPDKRRFISHFEFSDEGTTVEVKPGNVMHLMFTNPANPFWGLGPLQAASTDVDTDVEARRWNKQILSNSAVPSGILAYKSDLDDDQWLDARWRLREMHMGAMNAGAPMVVGNDARWQDLSRSPQEMAFIDGRKLTREEICSAFNVPPPVVGFFDQATYANAATAHLMFWTDAVIPILDALAAGLNRSLAPEFGEGLRLVYDTSRVKVLRAIPADVADVAVQLHSVGVPFNVINERLALGFPDVPGGDVGYVGGLPVDVGLVDTAGQEGAKGATTSKSLEAAVLVLEHARAALKGTSGAA